MTKDTSSQSSASNNTKLKRWIPYINVAILSLLAFTCLAAVLAPEFSMWWFGLFTGAYPSIVIVSVIFIFIGFAVWFVVNYLSVNVNRNGWQVFFISLLFIPIAICLLLFLVLAIGSLRLRFNGV